MKSMYEKPLVKVITVFTESFIAESEHGVIGEGDDMAKESQFEEENKTSIPDSYTSIWGDEEEKEN